MGFATPAWFALAALAAVPVLLHLWRSRHVPTRELPTVNLLQRARRDSRRRHRLIDRLLLTSRTLMILALALAASAPYCEVPSPEGTEAKAVGIVLDDSMSMAVTENGEMLFESARKRAIRLIHDLPADSEATLVLAGSIPRLVTPRTGDLQALVIALENVEAPGARGTELPAAVRLTRRELQRSRLAMREIIVLTDSAAHGRLDEVEWPSRGVQHRIERIGGEQSPDNRAITGAVLAADPTDPSGLAVEVEARAEGRTPSFSEVELLIGDERVDRTTLQVTREREGHAATGEDSGPSPPSVLHGRGVLHLPPSRGSRRQVDRSDDIAVAFVEHDALPIDDRRAVLPRSSDGVRVLLVNGDPHPTPAEDEVDLARRALELAPRSDGPFAVTMVDADLLTARDVQRTDVAILANVSSPNRSIAAALTDLLERGGGLLIAGGDRLQPQVYRSYFRDALLGRMGPASASAVPLSIAVEPNNSLGLPVAAGLAGTEVRRHHLLEGIPISAEIVLRFSDDSPALVLDHHEEGRTALLAVSLDQAFSDLPLRPGYLPLLSRLVHHLSSSEGAAKRIVEAGAVVDIEMDGAGSEVTITAPDGRSHSLVADQAVHVLHFDATAQAGTYRLQWRRASSEADRLPEPFLVVAPNAESSLARVSEVRAGDADGANARAAGVVPSVQGVGNGRAHQSLVPLCFLVFGLLGIAEAALRIRGLPGRARRATAPPG